MKARRVGLPDGRVWLRVGDPEWTDPLDPSWAAGQGGRWNSPGSYEVLYLNGDVSAARARIERMLSGSPVRMDDLDDSAYVLIAATLPRKQVCADAVTSAGLRALGLPDSYPHGSRGAEVSMAECQRVGAAVHAHGLRGVWCRSAATPEGRGRELAWFPATARSRARAVWKRPLPLGSWLHATSWQDLGLQPQAEPAPL